MPLSVARCDNPDGFGANGLQGLIYADARCRFVSGDRFQRCNLAVEQGGGHVVIFPCRHASGDQITRSVEMDKENSLARRVCQSVAVTAL